MQWPLARQHERNRLYIVPVGMAASGAVRGWIRFVGEAVARLLPRSLRAIRSPCSRAAGSRREQRRRSLTCSAGEGSPRAQLDMRAERTAAYSGGVRSGWNRACARAAATSVSSSPNATASAESAGLDAICRADSYLKRTTVETATPPAKKVSWRVSRSGSIADLQKRPLGCPRGRRERPLS
jgi:hypothetical protein